MKFKILVAYSSNPTCSKNTTVNLSHIKKKLELTQNSKYDVAKNQTFCPSDSSVIEVLFESYWDMYLVKSS